MAEMQIKPITMNFGPQHPGHGVLRLVLEMDGEVIERADPHIGLLHRGTEKLIEHKLTYRHCRILTGLIMSPMDRTAWALWKMRWALKCRAVPNISACCIARLGGCAEPSSQLTTLLSMWGVAPLLWGFEGAAFDGFYERACGARLHAAYFRPGGVHQDCLTISRDIKNGTKIPDFIDDWKPCSRKIAFLSKDR